MSDDEARQRQQQALELLTVRVNRDQQAWTALMGAELDELEPADIVPRLLSKLVGMTDLATLLVVQLAHLDEIVETPAEYVQVLATYLAAEGLD